MSWLQGSSIETWPDRLGKSLTESVNGSVRPAVSQILLFDLHQDGVIRPPHDVGLGQCTRAVSSSRCHTG